jgi:hypothetical protein
MILQNKIQKEMTEFKNDMLKEDKQTIFDQAFKITTYENTKAHFTNNLDFLTKSEVRLLENTDKILFQFYNYYVKSESEEINEEMIKDFLSYIV